MKRVFWLLVVINLGLLAYFNMAMLLPGKPEIKLTEIDPEKIKILTQAEIEALPKKAPELPAATDQIAASCYEWGAFSDIGLIAAQKMLTKLNLEATAKELNTAQTKLFWVYRAPVKTAVEAQKKAAELKALGVQDLFVVQEEKWKNAISFGIFEDEQLATKLMQELQAKGVKNLQKSPRSNGKGQHSLLFNTLSDAQIAEINQLKPNFPAAELKEVSCN
ncbi:MAG: sporulation protein [Methylotenera sp. 24-45-7]|nr:MAG: sporulation protein [Mehylophilales bacterium 35-46-6]OYZ40766.1 MAG: sporulation protein [Methylotenera sp. 24-45-7]OZA08559.1 MAG: sporulation protein [Methylotenera sp. 17-45-7]OZA53994.1 MAG: sporulation protein [Methylophilales bacterium 39-45-7]HQS37347.1 sporulation protein [Methylotenera sp.]